MKKNERLQALHILVGVLQDKTPLLHQLQAATDLSPLSKELCFGVCRQYYRLQAIADSLMSKRSKSIEIQLCILMGLYQLHYLRIPDYAVVKETVDLLIPLKKTWAKGLINAVLRNYCRQQDEVLTQMQNDRMFIHNHPDWLVKTIQKAWPQDWQAILQANDLHPAMSLRVNAARTARSDYLTRLQQAGIAATPQSFSPCGITLATPCDVYELPGFVEGDVSVQDEAAQLAAMLLDLQPNLRVLDACCAPGGKTCHILETQSHLSVCVALDIEKNRLKRVEENLNRLQLHASITQGDALQPQTWWDGELFDRILLDAPCSATGVIRRHPDIKLLRTKREIQAIVAIQHDLLETLWPLLTPGGIFIYATCSIMPEENELQIQRVVNTYTDCEMVTNEHAWGRNTGHGRQILPGENGMDGFFYSVLRKKH